MAGLRALPGLPAERYVSVAPDVLGRDLPLDSDGASDLPGAGVFTVITPDGWQAVQTLAPVAPRLLGVDEFGELHPPDWIPPSWRRSRRIRPTPSASSSGRTSR